MISALTVLATLVSAGHHDCSIDPDFCSAHAVSEPIRSCTEGFFFSEAENCCMMDVVYEPMLACPHSGEVRPDGTCVCESIPRITCPDGFTYDKYEATCVHTELVPMIPSCAHRPDLAGSLSEDGRQCYYYKDMPVKHKCPKGSHMENGECISYQSLPGDVLDFTCPDGWDLDFETEECVLVERVDCHQTKTKKSKCKSKGHKGCDFEPFQPCYDCVIPDEHRKLCANCKEKIKPEHLCQAASCKMAVKEANEKSFVEPVVCERVTKLPAKPTCRRGQYNPKKHSCCIATVSKPEAFCSGGAHKGLDLVGGCSKKMHYLSDYVCPAPYEVSCGSRPKKEKKKDKHSKVSHPSSCECVAMSFADPVPDCPHGCEYFPSSDRCVQTLLAEPYCPERDAELINGVCVRTEREPVRLEYTVTYVTEEPCALDQCIKEKVPIKKRRVTHKEVHMKGGKAKTKCHDSPCVDKHGATVLEHDPLPILVGMEDHDHDEPTFFN